MIQMIETIQNKFWRVMYITSPGKFPARALYTPPFRTRGMSGNRPFNRRCLYLLRQRVSTLSLYTPFFPLSNSVDIIFTEIIFSKSPLSQYKVFKVQTGELSEFLLGRSSPISEEKLCFQTLVFNLLTWFQLCLFFSSHGIRLCSIGNSYPSCSLRSAAFNTFIRSSASSRLYGVPQISISGEDHFFGSKYTTAYRPLNLWSLCGFISPPDSDC